MQYAIDKLSGEKIEANKESDAICPGCACSVIPKMGTIKRHHWAHKVLEDCDWDSEPETEWHLEWKSHFPKDRTEVAMNGRRADALTASGVVLEFQHSSITPETITEREAAHGRVIWVVDVSAITRNFSEGDKCLWWSWARKVWAASAGAEPKDNRGNIFLDFGDGRLWRVHEMLDGVRLVYGWWIAKVDFLARCNGGDTWHRPKWAKWSYAERWQYDNRWTVDTELRIKRRKENKAARMTRAEEAEQRRIEREENYQRKHQELKDRGAGVLSIARLSIDEARRRAKERKSVHRSINKLR